MPAVQRTATEPTLLARIADVPDHPSTPTRSTDPVPSSGWAGSGVAPVSPAGVAQAVPHHNYRPASIQRQTALTAAAPSVTGPVLAARSVTPTHPGPTRRDGAAPAMVAPILAARAATPTHPAHDEYAAAADVYSTPRGSTTPAAQASVQRSRPDGPWVTRRPVSDPVAVRRRSGATNLPAAGAIAVAAGLAREVAGGSVVFHPPDRSAPARPVARSVSERPAPNVQRAGPLPAVMAQPEPVPAPAVGLPAAVTGDRAGRPAGSVHRPAALGAADLDQLAGRLYDPLLYRLRAELWADRERAGLLADTW
jgi:hypothetical protein